MNYIFSFFFLFGIICFGQSGNLRELFSVINKATADCGQFVLKLLFMTAFFSGIIKIGEDCGIVRKLSTLLHFFLKRIFQTKNQQTLDKIAMNISANMLGIGNAATPSGLAAMQALDSENDEKEHPSRDMCRFLLFNTCSVQLIPTTIFGLRAMAGSENPAVILLPVLIVSVGGLMFGLLLCHLLFRIQK